jgi:hypothetical protein
VRIAELGRRSTIHGHDLFWGTIAALVGLGRNRITLQLTPIPLAGNMRATAGTKQLPFMSEAFNQRCQKRPVTVRAAAKQISGMALRTLDAVANTGSHGTSRPMMNPVSEPLIRRSPIEHSEGDGARMDIRGLNCRELDVLGRGYSPWGRTADCRPKTSRSLAGVGYDLGGRRKEF